MFRISLRELLGLVAAIALAIVSLRSGSYFWQGAVGLVAMLAIGMALITGIIDRGSRRAFAVGAAITMFGFAVLFAVYRNAELNSVEPILPTTALLRSIHPTFVRSGYVDSPNGTFTVNGKPVHFVEQPLFREFMSIGNAWFVLVFGYIGGWFARFVYMRRSKESSPPVNQNAAG